MSDAEEAIVALREVRLAAARRMATDYHTALDSIAAWREADAVSGAFDEPCAALVARRALASWWVGPCLHGRDPWDRCDECGELAPEVAMSRAVRAERGYSCVHYFRPDPDTDGRECTKCGFYRGKYDE
jgi:hypothetical protein